MNTFHDQKGGEEVVQLRKGFQLALSELHGMDHRIISKLRSDLFRLLQEQRELHLNIDLWQFALEIDHTTRQDSSKQLAKWSPSICIDKVTVATRLLQVG